MEFDNDRLRPKPIRVTNLCWIPLLLIYPLVNACTLYPGDWTMVLVLFFVNLVLSPAYFLYGREVIWLKRYIITGLLSVGAFFILYGFVSALFAFMTILPFGQTKMLYFEHSGRNFQRESLWIVLNLFFSFVIAWVQRYMDEKKEREEARKENLFFKLRYLRAQLNPHFLFNTLNSIYSLSLHKSERAPEIVVKLADLMRYLIYECNEETIPLEKEVDFIRNYIELEQIRYKADIRFQVEGDLKGVMIEPFLFIAFIENGFKHAMDSSFSEPFIYITLKVGKGKITLNVLNSTDADLETQAKRMNGKGITNSKSMLELLYPGSYELDIIQTDREESRQSQLRLQHARDRLESLYPNAYDLDIILNKNAFTVSLVLKSKVA